MNFRKHHRRNSLNLVSDTEKWRHNTKRISIKDTIDVSDLEEDSDENDLALHESIDWKDEYFTLKDNSSITSDQDVEISLTNKQTLILATMVPNELLLMDEFEDSKKFVGVLLMADVSGFTALSERYHNTGKGGAYRLTVTLNTYLGSLIELIYSHGGDVVKFAGDAFLALWKSDKRTYLCHTIHTVIACCLIIQHSYASYETDVKVNLKVKLAISAGNLIFAPIGSGTDKNFVLTGLPVFEAKDAESVCASGEVTLSATAWGHCYSRNYDHIEHEDGHITIRSILYDPRENNVSKPFSGLGGLLRQYKKRYCAIENLPNEIWDEHVHSNVVNALKANATLSLRETILEGIEKNNGGDIRKFMIRPVVQQIDAHQPLEYLTEMRIVTVMFITLKPNKCAIKELITIVNKAYEITCDIVYKNMGCVNKIILFDKDVMILIIFGLRGFKHESEAQAALKSAYIIRKALSFLDGVSQVSIGVTTGQVYCGVVGHPLRREFTVIGAVVNKAARLMCYFREKITCDEATYVKSKMSSNSFTLQPHIQLKGIENTGKIYEYNEEIRMNEIQGIPIITPLLNRFRELEIFDTCVKHFHLRQRDYDGILIVGDNRIGKTRLLEWMTRQGRSDGFQICSVNLTSIHSATPYLAINQIINQLLGLKETLTDFEKEEKIVQTLKEYNDDFCNLNDIIKTRFAYHEGIFSQNDFNRNETCKKIFRQLVTAINEDFLICIDDLHNMDPFSWEFISTILPIQNLFSVITIRKEKITAEQSWLYDVFVTCNIKKLVLTALSPDCVAPLACQILDADAVPNDLCSALQSKCKCMPGLIESFILHLFSTGAIDIKKVNNEEFRTMDLSEFQLPDCNLLRSIALNKNDQNELDKLKQDEISHENKLCIIIDKNELNTNINVQNVDVLVTMQIDSLTPYQQLLLKIASVIGTIVSRDLLENIMYENSYITTAKAVKRLFSMKLLSCANSRNRWNSKSDPSCSSLHTSDHLCDCNFVYDEEDSNDLPKYAFCKLMRFKNKRTRKTCYELLPLNQKKEFHTRVVNYLEQDKTKCPDCGGSVLVVKSFTSTRSQSCVSSIDKEIYDDDKSFTRANLSSMEGESYEYATSNNGTLPHSRPCSAEKSFLYKTKSEMIKHDENMKQSTSSINRNSTNSIHLMHHPSILKSNIFEYRRSTKRVTMPSILFKALSFGELQTDRIFTKIRIVAEADDIKDWEELGFKDTDKEKSKSKLCNKKSYRINLEKGVSQTDFRKCTCAELRIFIYEQLIHHATQADLKSKVIEFLIKFCKLNITHNIIINILDKLLVAEAKCTENCSTINKFERNLFLGQIYTIRAGANIIQGNFSAAKFNIERALRIFHIRFNKLSSPMNIKKNLTINHRKRKYRGNEAILKKECVICLNVATVFYNSIGHEKLARITASQALRLLRRLDCSAKQVCDAYNNAMKVELDRGNPEGTDAIERLAQESLRNLSSPVVASDLFYVGKLFLVTFQARIARAMPASAIRSGFRSLVLSRFVNAHDVSLEIIPDLFYLLLSRSHVEEAIDLLSELLRMADNGRTTESDIWYYALCMDMILDAGFQLEYPGNIIRFGDYILSKKKFTANSAAWRRLVVNIWTYCLRCDTEWKTKKWEVEAMRWANRGDHDSTLTTINSALRLAEGMLESLSRKVDDLRRVVDLMELRSLSERELNQLERSVRQCRATYPRWLMLRSSCMILSGRNSAGASLISQAAEEAKRTGNHLDLAKTIPYSNQYWQKGARTGYFVDWQDAADHVQASWHLLVYRIGTQLN